MAFAGIRNRLAGKQKAKRKRRYINPAVGVEGFFKALEAERIDYCVLRWFETLPELDEGEDIDILVADKDLERIGPHFTGRRKRGIPCDIYSVSGLPGSDHRKISYFIPALARAILESADYNAHGIRVPDPYHHLLSMAYHAAYHKGYDSGLPVSPETGPRRPGSEHDYHAVLTELAEAAGISLPHVSLSGVHHFLEEHGYAPPADTLEKLADRNEWVRDRFFSDVSFDPKWSGLCTFLVRERGLEHIKLIRSLLERQGFSLLREFKIDQPHCEVVAENIRGGNWGRGPWPKSGGAPAYALIMLDLFPVPPSSAALKKHFTLTNERVLSAKKRVRETANTLFARDQRCNVLHSSDNEQQALHYAELLGVNDGGLDSLAGNIEQLRKQVASPWPVLARLPGHGRRAVVHLIDFDGQEAVCKTFRPGAERFMKREQLAREIGAGLAEVPPILAQKGLHLVLPKYHPAEGGRYFSPEEIARIRRIILHFRKRGYELIDFKPGNIIRDSDGGLKILDFEFMQLVESKDTIEGCYCWYRIPDDTALDIPHHTAYSKTNYDRYWRRMTGVPLWMAIRDMPSWLITATQLGSSLSMALRRALRTFGSKLRELRHRRRKQRGKKAAS